MDGLSAEQQALLASIMGNSSQAKALNPTVTPVATPAPSVTAAPSPAPAPAAPAMPAAGGNENRVLSQAEIDALFAAMT